MHVEFITQLRVTKTNGKWTLLDPFVVRVDDYPWVVPAGYKTDFASVPRVPFAYLLAGNAAHKAAVLHDYMYSKGYDRKLADDIFYYAMEAEGVPDWRRNLMYAAVRAFGGSAYQKSEDQT
jgi:hypothetical protein